MKYTLTIEKFEDSKAVCKTNEGDLIIWPQDKLPADCKEGSTFSINLSADANDDAAKNILNEILN